MKYHIAAIVALMIVVRSCDLVDDPYCCNGIEYVNECFAWTAGEDMASCQHRACGLAGGIKDIAYNSAEWNDTQQYVDMLDSTINAKLLEAGVRFNYGCWDHQRLKQARSQLVNGWNYWVKLQLLCDPAGYYGHVYFYVPFNMDAEGHIEFPRPQLMAIQYPKLAHSALDVFREDAISINKTST
mmetsp:Transcript_44656/g.71475  ORF Transcript_44656/g.71475 Transcript_44656/m.71475 type:complete len:184 (+) Transcript_44656:86-637(+)|eukprot:CAMPEP_0197022526 /NCGR_PEP_ID=MMETSP1384-20130603/3373_1 /TAXON_ID=29189 /ORGANISM="Ammonia sp." /LENGTH=183 /DNA_ID=CAMNT_0042450583 /DNA_START=69 /DNA_END=620 /DNA_ORIENTATION=+